MFKNLKPIAVVHGIFVYSTMMIFEYSGQKYLNIRIRSTFVLRIYSYSYSVQNMILNIFVFVFVLKRTFRIYLYSYSVPKKIFATLWVPSISKMSTNKSLVWCNWTEKLTIIWKDDDFWLVNSWGREIYYHCCDVVWKLWWAWACIVQ